MTNKKEVWPVMLTPFCDDGKVDYSGVRALIEWYESAGVDGLFAVCQSSEMFFLSLDERVKLAAFVKKHSTLPVIASGHIAADESQIDELRQIASTGIDGLVLVTNRFAEEHDSPEQWQNMLELVVNALDPATPLGLYECPHPFKRLLSDEELKICRDTGRFKFLKDTCCDISIINRRLKILEGSGLKLYNANTTTLLDSFRLGSAGFSGVMANFHPELYVALSQIWERGEHAELLQSFLTICSSIESRLYPVNAKYHLQQLGLPIGTFTRSKDHAELSELYKDEVRQMDLASRWIRKECI